MLSLKVCHGPHLISENLDVESCRLLVGVATLSFFLLSPRLKFQLRVLRYTSVQDMLGAPGGSSQADWLTGKLTDWQTYWLFSAKAKIYCI